MSCFATKVLNLSVLNAFLTRSRFFKNWKRLVKPMSFKQLTKITIIKRSNHCGIAVYQLAKIQIIEFFYGYLKKYLIWQDFELCYMDTNYSNEWRYIDYMFRELRQWGIFMNCISPQVLKEEMILYDFMYHCNSPFRWLDVFRDNLAWKFIEVNMI